MRFLRTLSEGDKFRPAWNKQVSLNGRLMPREVVFRITKVYPQSPYTTIAVEANGNRGGIFSLGPGTPVLLPKELNPTEEEVQKFLSKRGRKIVVAYKLKWDGKTTLRWMVTPQAEAVLKLMFAMGKREYDRNELHKLLDKHFQRFLGRPSKLTGRHVLLYYRRSLANLGLIEEIVDEAPQTQGEVAANINAVMEEA